MLTHREAVDRFVAEMREKGVGPWTSAPPLYRVLWACGSKVPPPYFIPTRTAALLLGSCFAVFWGLTMWFTEWRDQPDRSLLGAIVASVGGGTAFGLVMGWFHARRCRRLNLPSWEQFLARGGAERC